VITLVVSPVSANSRGQTFSGTVDGRLIVSRSTAPFCDGARMLLAEGADPAEPYVMRHAGSETDALKSTVGAAAKMTVWEGDKAPYFGPWKASKRFAEASPIEF
jgi:hypothetical protein